MSEAAANCPLDSESYATGFRMIDEVTNGGLNNGDLVIISAPTGMGKTSLAQTLTYHLSRQAIPCLWFSYEIVISNLWKKFLAMGMNTEDVVYSPLKTTAGNIEWVEKKIREAKEKHMIKVVVIDHLGFVLPRAKIEDVSKNYSAYLGQICRELKTIAIHEEVIIILPVHMRKTDKPDINDIRDSSGIAQEADLVITLSREINSNEEGEYYTNYTQAVLAKNRKTGKSSKKWLFMRNELFEEDDFYKPQKVKNKYIIKKYEQSI
jgi:replicative DNA helicase